MLLAILLLGPGSQTAFSSERLTELRSVACRPTIGDSEAGMMPVMFLSPQIQRAAES